MKIPVSIYVIAKLLSPISSPSDELFEKLDGLDMNNTTDISNLVRIYITPHFNKYDYESRLKIKNSLEYYACVGGGGLRRLFPMFHIPFEEPESMMDFFSLLWEGLFDHKLSCDKDFSDFEEFEDVDFSNTLYRTNKV